MSRLVLVAAVCIGLIAGGGAVASDAGVVVVLSDDTLVAGEEATLDLQIVNRETVAGETMQGTTVEVDAGDAPLTVRTAERSLGNVPTGASRTAPFDVVVDENATPGTYDLEVTVTYRTIEDDGEVVPEATTETETIDLEVTIEERARFAVVNATTDVHVGEPGAIELELKNVGTETARNATVEVQSIDPGLQIGGGTTFTRTFSGEWAVDETRTVRLATRATDDTEARVHALDVTVRFYDSLGVRRSDDVHEPGVEVGPEQEFAVGNVTSTLRVGEDGRVDATIRNEGNRSLENVVAILASPNPNVDVRDTESSVGTLEPGEQRDISFRVRLDDGADPDERLLPLAVRYRTPGGDVVVGDPVDVVDVAVAPKQEFAVEDVTSTLQVGKDGRVNATIRNEANRTIEGVVAIVESPNPNIAVRDPEWYVGTLGPGEQRDISFRVGLREDAEPGERALPLVVRYRTPYADNLLSDQIDVPVIVAEKIEPFEVEAISRTITQGEEITYRVEIRNAGDERYTDIEAQLFATPPLAVTDGEAYVPGLAPGESTEIAFGLEAEDDATPTTYSVSIDFRYEDEIGDRHLTDRQRLPVDVLESEPSPIVFVAVAALLVGVFALAYWQRERLRRVIDDLGPE
ncbi:S-layer domain-containing protein [Halalkaliarchaeum desulfuricum]|uniref:S-layer domain-containing protein n=1 Tax=Halalkaliarchaeum desulfuricum TaxID=2055893 RepID=A0A343TII1_9EURY|nr:S-layer domain-containing protein [Halalkaliarchaeum desulfuricum]